MFWSDKAKLVGILTAICVLYNIPKFFIYIDSENLISYTEFDKIKLYEVFSWFT